MWPAPRAAFKGVHLSIKLFDAPDQVEEWAKEATFRDAVIRTGYPGLDRYLKGGGIRRGQCACLMARSEVGKSWLALNLIVNAIIDGYSVVFSSQEMTVAEVTNRLMAIHFGLDPLVIEQQKRSGTFDPALEQRYRNDFRNLSVYDYTEPTFDDLGKAIQLHDENAEAPCALFVQDYSDYMRLDRDDRYGNSAQKANTVAKRFAQLAKTRNIVVLTLVQTGRASEGDSSKRDHGHKMVTKEAIMYGGEQAFGIMLGIWRPELDPLLDDEVYARQNPDDYLQLQADIEPFRGKAFVNLAKNRYGPSHRKGVLMDLDWGTGRWKETPVSSTASPDTTGGHIWDGAGSASTPG